MPLYIVRQDITKMNTDAVVAAEGHDLSRHGQVGSAIAEAAGEGYRKACEALGYCDTGDARITDGFDLPAKYVIHTVGPQYKDGHSGENILLRSCYEKSLELARENGCRSIAFPAIATGDFGYPGEEGLKIVADTIEEFLKDNEMDVYLVVFDRETALLSHSLGLEVDEYIDDNYVGEEQAEWERSRSERGRRRLQMNIPSDGGPVGMMLNSAAVPYVPADGDRLPADGGHVPADRDRLPADGASPKKHESLESVLKMHDENFTQMLFRLIEEKGLSNPEVYTRANISKSHFSKIKNSTDYRPKKETVFALAVALELDIEETKELLMRAGYAISHAFILDTIVEYFIVNGRYNIMDINFALFDHDQPLLGEKAL